MEYLVSLLGFLIAFFYSFSREKDKYDKKKQDFNFLIYLKESWDNYGFTLLLAIVWAMYGVDIWSATIEPLVNFIAQRFYTIDEPIKMPFHEAYYLLSGVFGWVVYHGIPTAKNLFNGAMRRIKGGKK